MAFVSPDKAQLLLFPEVRVGVGSDEPEVRPVNVASVPMRSPFRYPGGKAWLIQQLRRWMRSLGRKPSLFVEPFAGGRQYGPHGGL
jgi:DNA adenine methylase